MTRSAAVGVTATVEVIRGALRVRVNEAYTHALLTFGLLPLVIPPITDDEALQGVLDRVDGLVLTGGEDVAPHQFRAVPHAATDEPNEARDHCELTLARLAHARRMPTLAICRGIQVMNVAFGGTLVQDIPTERPGSQDHNPGGDRSARVHSVSIEPNSQLARILGTECLTTNSFHHQSINDLGDGLRVTGTTADGIIEGIETTDPSWWMIGVQWHPEELTATPEDWDRRLFGSFADRVRSGNASEPRRGPAASAAPESTRSGKKANR